jgi:hypothetical protein
MLNDVFALSMGGRYSTTRGDQLFESGEWGYRGYGNAEVTMHATGQLLLDGISYHLRIHGSERQLNEVYCRSAKKNSPSEELSAVIGGRSMDVTLSGGDRQKLHSGVLSVPDEAIFMGPSPIWYIYMMMILPPPTDRQVTAPALKFALGPVGVNEELYLIDRAGARIRIARIDVKGVETAQSELWLAEDGVPTHIRSGDFATEVLRIPQT